MNQPTMADIADHLGVSRQLVSIVLRDMPGASADTRDRVQRAARELGYSPHIGARTLRQSRSRHLGVAFAPAHASEPDIVEQIYPVAAEHGYQVALSAHTRTRSTEAAVDELMGHRCAAIILIGTELPDRELRTLARRAQVPVVVIGPTTAQRNSVYDVVRSAGDVGIGLTTRHLVELGHRRIAYVHSDALPPGELRRRGYLEAMTAASLDTDVVEVLGSDYTEECGADAARTLLARPELPTAVVAGNDQEAVGVLQVLARAGVDVPGQVSLTGFDDTRFASLSSVALTTARQDPAEMGEAAIAAAVRRVEQPQLRPRLTVVAPSLVVRTSTQAPRRAARSGSRRP